MRQKGRRIFLPGCSQVLRGRIPDSGDCSAFRLKSGIPNSYDTSVKISVLAAVGEDSRPAFRGAFWAVAANNDDGSEIAIRLVERNADGRFRKKRSSRRRGSRRFPTIARGIRNRSRPCSGKRLLECKSSAVRNRRWANRFERRRNSRKEKGPARFLCGKKPLRATFEEHKMEERAFYLVSV